MENKEKVLKEIYSSIKGQVMIHKNSMGTILYYPKSID